jgi:hypothetical protein
MFSALGHVFGDTEGVRSFFHVLRSRTLFRWYKGRRVLFSCFVLLESFSAVPSASGLVFMFYAPGLVFCGTEGIGANFHVLRALTHFRRYRWRRVQFSCFTLPDSFSAVPRVSGPVLMFCAPALAFGGTMGVGSRFHVLPARSHFRRYLGRPILFSCFPRINIFSAVPRASGPVFMFCALGLIFGGTECVSSHFHVFPFLDMFSAIQRAFGPVFMFCVA